MLTKPNESPRNLGYSVQNSVASQRDNLDSIAVALLSVWVTVRRSTLQMSPELVPANSREELSAISRLAEKYRELSPTEMAGAIRKAADIRQTELADKIVKFPALYARDIENQMQEAMRAKHAKAVNENPVGELIWYGNPSDALDLNWPRIWKRSCEESIRRGEKCRMFEFDYLDVFTDIDRKQIAVRDAAFIELCKRAKAAPSYDAQRARQMVREEMYRCLMAIAPKYKLDIEREIWTIDHSDLNDLSNRIYDMNKQRGAMIFVLRPTLESCGRSVWFDLYVESLGLEWPSLDAKPAPKESSRPMSNYSFVPKSLKDL